MKIKSIDIEGIGGIKGLHIDFDDHMNFICGPNGIGKTTVLECVAHSFSANSTNILKRNVSTEHGNFRATVEIDNCILNSNVTIGDFDPDKPSSISGLHRYAGKLLSLKVTRTFQYQQLHAVSKDADKSTSTSFEEAKFGVNIHEVKNWFVNRYLYSVHKGALTDEQLHNLEIAKKAFSLLNEGFSFKKVLASSNEIMIDSPSGEIYYEYLSSGFKSCLSIIFGIIKDIELRFKSPCIKADEFDGIILIDELELHLHPEWQSKIASILVDVFPKIQFIASTHSPHIIQNAKPNEIIALALNGGDVYRRQLNGGSYGFQGWTVEEVLTDVMGMSDTRTETYYQLMSKFEAAIDSDNYNIAKIVYQELELLLHPENHLRKLLKFQLASVKGEA
ncbi:AAA family ATPase [Shewanella sp. MM_2022_3]|uniref:AAA family ATPase n=1 Tax=Shewanella sp. MM_2022_3 TaxID=2923280 RepID=UPI001F4BEE25|nr:AAA family ATPase [Shewanella sp. MM_2022_3]MCH7423887.1 AAA family ATPase [Shewanella sp. MM_2022_3]